MPSPEAVNPKSISALANRKDVTLEKILVPIDFSENAQPRSIMRSESEGSRARISRYYMSLKSLGTN